MKTLTTVIFLLLTATISIAQNPLWTLPPNFSSEENIEPLPIPPEAGPPDPAEVYYYTGFTPDHAHNAMHDQNNNLMFFVVDDKIFDRNGYGIYMLSAPSTPQDVLVGNSEVCIVPDPVNCTQYHIFTSGGSHHKYPFYSMLDMSLPSIWNPGAMGAPAFGTELYSNSLRLHVAFDFEDQNGNPINMITNTHGGYSFAATKLLPDGVSRLVFISEGPIIYRLKIDENGINPINPPLHTGGSIFPTFDIFCPLRVTRRGL